MTYWTEVDPPCSFIPENWTYEQKREFRYKELDYLHDAVNFPSFKGKKVLCVGDGSGIDAIEFARYGAHRVYAVDMSEKAVLLTGRHAYEAIDDKLINGHSMLMMTGNACALDLPDQLFDAVYCFGVLHHIPEVNKAVSEIARVLKPGGLFLGMVYHKDSLYYGYSILRRAQREGITPDEAMRQYSERNPGCPHSIAYSMGELSVVLDPFSRIDMWEEYPVIDLPERRKVRVDMPSNLGWHLFFTAIK